MTAVPGAGALAPPLLGDFPPWPEPAVEPPDDDDDDDPVEPDFSLSCCANGSLLANRLNDVNWPSATTGTEEEASGEPGVVVALGVWLPPRVGAARLGVPAVEVVVELDDEDEDEDDRSEEHT